jgi:thymidylate synthase (FAD)
MSAKPIRGPSMRNPDFSSWVAGGRPSCAALDGILGKTYSPIRDNLSCGVLVDYMGNEASILRAARMSTGKEVGECDADGIPTQPEDQRLLPRLLKDRHTSPFEVAQFSFVIQCPIFVARQWMRHRTESYNEASGRYTILDVEFFTPDGSEIRFESGIGWDHSKAEQAADLLAAAYANQESTYDALVGLGVHREQARMVLGTALYTRMLVTVDLHNLMNFLALRMAPDAQYEIRQFAKVMWAMIAQMSPMCAASIIDRIRSIHPNAFEGWPTPMSPNTAKNYANGMLGGCCVAPPYRDPSLTQDAE